MPCGKTFIKKYIIYFAVSGISPFFYSWFQRRRGSSSRIHAQKVGQFIDEIGKCSLEIAHRNDENGKEIGYAAVWFK